MKSSYSDLSTYRTCPRLLSFKRQGWSSPEFVEPLTTGSLFHAGIAAYFKGKSPDLAMDALVEKIYQQFDEEDHDEKAELRKAKTRAGNMLRRYIKAWVKDYTPIEAELELICGEAVCHIDLVAYYKDTLVITDYKTGHQPDARWYDMSGQVDLYAYVYHEVTHKMPGFIIYDCIADEGIFRHVRKPRPLVGYKLWGQLNVLAFEPEEDLMGNPHPRFDCPNRCDFFIPCHFLETGSKTACMDYLEENFIKEETDATS